MGSETSQDLSNNTDAPRLFYVLAQLLGARTRNAVRVVIWGRKRSIPFLTSGLLKRWALGEGVKMCTFNRIDEIFLFDGDSISLFSHCRWGLKQPYCNVEKQKWMSWINIDLWKPKKLAFSPIFALTPISSALLCAVAGLDHFLCLAWRWELFRVQIVIWWYFSISLGDFWNFGEARNLILVLIRASPILFSFSSWKFRFLFSERREEKTNLSEKKVPPAKKPQQEDSPSVEDWNNFSKLFFRGWLSLQPSWQ